MRKPDDPPTGRRRGLPLPLELPGIEKPDDLLPALHAVGQAMAEGRITPAECRTLGSFVECHRKVIEAVEFEKRLRHVEVIAEETRRLKDSLLDLARTPTQPEYGAAPVPAPGAGP